MRKNYIDVLKGIGIFFVVFGHVTRLTDLHTFVWNFHMPLFFVISGFLNNSDKYPDYKNFVISKIKSIYIPYVLFFLATFLYWVVIEKNFRGGGYSVFHQLIGLFYGTYEGNHMYFNGALWFLPCLFSVELLFFYISRIKNKVGIFAFLILSFCLGTFIKQYDLSVLPFGIHTALFAIVFFGIGFLSKGLEGDFLKLSFPNKVIFWVGCTIVQVLALVDGFHGTIETTTVYYFPVAICGILFWYILAIQINKNRILEYMGTNSLIILGFQEPIYRLLIEVFRRVLHLSVDDVRTNLYYSLIISIICIIVIVPIIYVYNRYVRAKINALFTAGNSPAIRPVGVREDSLPQMGQL